MFRSSFERIANIPKKRPIRQSGGEAIFNLHDINSFFYNLKNQPADYSRCRGIAPALPQETRNNTGLG